MTGIALRVTDLRIGFHTANGLADAVRGVNLEVARGEAVGLVGESGSGKSLTAFSVIGLLPPNSQANGKVLLGDVDILSLDERAMRHVRGRDVAMVFQEPLTSLNPAFTIGQQLTDTIRAHERLSLRAATDRAIEVLSQVGIPEPRKRLGSYPHHFSGGMRQRVLIAMAISCGTDVLIADEPTTALDVTVQAQIVELLRKLRKERGLTLLFISHNLDLVAELCDRVVVMYAGRVVEQAATDVIFSDPRHPYTQLLQACIPRIEGSDALASIPGGPPRAGEQRSGCYFADRCPKVFDRCHREEPPLRGSGSHLAACWLVPA